MEKLNQHKIMCNAKGGECYFKVIGFGNGGCGYTGICDYQLPINTGFKQEFSEKWLALMERFVINFENEKK